MMDFEYIEKDMFRQKSLFPLFPYRMGEGYKFLKMPFWEGSKEYILWGIKQNPGYMVKMVNVVYCGEEPCWQQERTYVALPDRFDKFLPDLMELSLTHTIIGIRGEAVFVSQSLDHSTNIDQDVVAAFQYLFLDKH
jgi:hypothetical protein